ITRATRDAVLHVERRGQNLEVGINATHEIKGAHVRIAGAKQIVDLTPSKTFTRTIPAPKGKYAIELLDAGSRLLLSQKEGDFDGDRNGSAGPEAGPDRVTPLEIGTDHELNEQYLQAWSTYESSLRAAPGDYDLTKAAGRAALNLKRFDDAARLLHAAQL